MTLRVYRYMPFGCPISILPSDKPPRNQHDDWTGGWIQGSGGGWKPCRISFSRWNSSPGEWKEPRGYRDYDVPPYHQQVCEHRPTEPRALSQEEMNFSDLDDLKMHDPVVWNTADWRLRYIMRDSIENYHIVLRKEGGDTFLTYIFEDVSYEPKLNRDTFASLGIGTNRSTLCLKVLSRLKPCPKCAEQGEVTLEIPKLQSVHGDYRGSFDSLFSSRATPSPRRRMSIYDGMRTSGMSWLYLDTGSLRIAIPFSVLRTISEVRRWNSLRSFPPAR